MAQPPVVPTFTSTTPRLPKGPNAAVSSSTARLKEAFCCSGGKATGSNGIKHHRKQRMDGYHRSNFTLSTVCIPEGSRDVVRKDFPLQFYSGDGIDSINPTDGSIRFLQIQRTTFWKWSPKRTFNFGLKSWNSQGCFLCLNQIKLLQLLRVANLLSLPKIVGGTTRFEEENKRLCLTYIVQHMSYCIISLVYVMFIAACFLLLLNCMRCCIHSENKQWWCT